MNLCKTTPQYLKKFTYSKIYLRICVIIFFYRGYCFRFIPYLIDVLMIC